MLYYYLHTSLNAVSYLTGKHQHFNQYKIKYKSYRDAITLLGTFELSKTFEINKCTTLVCITQRTLMVIFSIIGID